MFFFFFYVAFTYSQNFSFVHEISTLLTKFQLKTGSETFNTNLPILVFPFLRPSSMELGERHFSQSRGSEMDGGVFFFPFPFFRGPGSKVVSASPSLSMRTLAPRMPLPPHSPCPRSIPSTTSSHSKSVGLWYERPPLPAGGGRGEKKKTPAEGVLMGRGDCLADVSGARQRTRPIGPKRLALPRPTSQLKRLRLWVFLRQVLDGSPRSGSGAL